MYNYYGADGSSGKALDCELDGPGSIPGGGGGDGGGGVVQIFLNPIVSRMALGAYSALYK